MTRQRKPEWLRVNYNQAETKNVRELMADLSLKTVCNEANCPNMATCFRHGTATFMILGSVCTRQCRFCNVSGGKPEMVDPDEPQRIAEAIEQLGLRHVVITCVTRDDLPDGGAGQFVRCIEAIRTLPRVPVIELLTSDLRGNMEALQQILDAKPEVMNHNMETVEELYKSIRPQARYQRSLDFLAYCKQHSRGYVKTGFMLGLGETDAQVERLMKDVRETNCDMLTIGQYLRPSKEHAEMVEYVHPDRFAYWQKRALEMGFKSCQSGPLVRSSYLADEAYRVSRGDGALQIEPMTIVEKPRVRYRAKPELAE